MLQKINILKTRLYLLMAHELAMCIHNKNKYTIYLIIMRKTYITSGACAAKQQIDTLPHIEIIYRAY